MHKIPYLLVVGDKESKSKTISVRARGGKDLGEMPLENFVKKVLKEVESKKNI